MNKFIFLLTLLIILFSGCKENNLILESKSTIHPIIINYNSTNNIVYGIKIPILLIINNTSSFSSKEFITIDYRYNSYNKGVGEEIYLENNNEILRLKNNNKKIIPKLKANKYLIYSRYRIDRFDKQNKLQKEFKPYVEKMLAKNQDTLHIGTVAEFKQKHKDLFEKLTKNDSISIQFLDNDKLGKRITVPVKWN